MTRSKKFTVITLAVMVGLIIGLVIASNLNWMNLGVASNTQVAPKLAKVDRSEPVPAVLLDLEAASKTYVQIAKKASPSVVMITSERVVKSRSPFFHFFGDEWFKRFFEFPEEGEQIQRGLGSGVIVSSDGYILTNDHVIKDADKLQVVINGEEYKAEVVGSDPNTDIAVVKIDKNNLKAIELGNSDELQVGEIVLAIGSPFSTELENTVTQGIVSAKGRKGLQISGSRMAYQDFIQTDAAINPGNSGGALVNLRGKLVGINTAIVGQTSVGVGFAIPVNMAKWVMGQLIDKGKVVRGWLGVEIGPVSRKMAKAFGLESPHGALVHRVLDGPAKDAGVEEGDIIIELDGKKIKDNYDLINLVAKYDPGTRVELVVIREGKRKSLRVKLDERPDEETLVRRSTREKENQLGFRVSTLTDDLRRRYSYDEDIDANIIVTYVARNSQAAREQIRPGDLILKLNHQQIKSVRQFNNIIDEAKPGDVLLFRIQNRSGKRFVALEIPEKE